MCIILKQGLNHSSLGLIRSATEKNTVLHLSEKLKYHILNVMIYILLKCSVTFFILNCLLKELAVMPEPGPSVIATLTYPNLKKGSLLLWELT